MLRVSRNMLQKSPLTVYPYMKKHGTGNRQRLDVSRLLQIAGVAPPAPLPVRKKRKEGEIPKKAHKMGFLRISYSNNNNHLM